ncbi:hypothetical protein BU24DRAFT_197119 [Aaosphaeria arxii CBS 175.79]|uniref:Uncharacterized protein n=1 Tax=Aaosphaeria arxii CBS 175.79 TaxID=1450172 RepID=A0A6A5XSR2_9PLEO|nr:uncharacterized protein BU24DRAFT_197119 [Aaosphaeria arxii CBS 175.79]KAF2016232.1 hypothetical protein BU24DRAFT_197119 [Aaosphaeria arxii CBS 175.79]
MTTASSTMEDPPPVRWDRAKWITVFSSHSPTIREITECLGLSRAPSTSTTNRGIPKFDAPESKKISSEVQRLSKDLPKDRDALLDFAADPHSLDNELNELLSTLGPAIWGRHADRNRLLVPPDPTKKTYYKDLYYEDPEDRAILQIHLHRWVIIKACYYIRNMKLKRTSAADEYEIVADIDVDSPGHHRLLSPSQTPRSGTPVYAESDYGTTNPANPLKRKSDTYRSYSDGEDNTGFENSSTFKRRPYDSATMPIQRHSPRKPIPSARLSSENIPPSLSPTNHFQPHIKPDNPNPDVGRLLSPLSNSALNGTSRPPNPPPAAFTSANINAPATNFPPANRQSPSITPPGHHSHPLIAPAVQPVSAPSHYSSPYSTPIAPLPPIVPNPSEPRPLEGARPPIAPSSLRDSNRNSSSSIHTPGHTPPGLHASTTSTKLPSLLAPALGPASGPTSGPPSTHTPFHVHGIAPLSHARAPSHTPPSTSTHPTLPVNGAVRGPPSLPPSGTIAHPPPPALAQAPVPALAPAPAPAPPMNGYVVPPIQHGSTSSRLPSVKDTTLLQCELLGLLMRYFFPRNGPPCEEGELLYNLEYVWAQNEPVFARVMGTLFEYQRRVFFAWVDERRKISQLQNAMSGHPILHASEMVDRLLAMNDLRVMRLKWKAMKSHDGNNTLSPEDILCKTLATMTKTEGTEHLFKDGLDRVNESIFGFLKSEDMKISMHLKQQAE